MGVDFNEIKLIEFSMVSVPCNPDCYVLGSVASSQSAPSDAKMADLRREARALAAKARSISESIQRDPIPTRDQRVAESLNFKRLAAMAGRS